MRQHHKRLRLALVPILAFAVAGVGVSAYAMSPDSKSDSTSGDAEKSAKAETRTFTQEVGTKVNAEFAVDYTESTERAQKIHKAGASYIKVHFSKLKLSDGDYITVSSPEGDETYTYHGDPTAGAKASGDASYTVHGDSGFAAMSVEGDTAIVKLHSKVSATKASELAAGDYGVAIDSYWRGYDAKELVANNPVPESVCGVEGRKDAICYQDSYPGRYKKSKAVARMLIGGSSLCTTWRVGSTNRMLTNNHCTADQAGVESSEIQFDYECATCDGDDPKEPVKVAGDTMVMTSEPLDYTLYSVQNFETIKPFGTLFLDPREPEQGEKIYIPQHGGGNPKQLGVFAEEQDGVKCTIEAPNADDVNAGYACDTEGGSSGSPVLAAHGHKVIALHHLGTCPHNLGVRITLVHDEISGEINNDWRAYEAKHG